MLNETSPISISLGTRNRVGELAHVSLECRYMPPSPQNRKKPSKLSWQRQKRKHRRRRRINYLPPNTAHGFRFVREGKSYWYITLVQMQCVKVWCCRWLQFILAMVNASQHCILIHFLLLFFTIFCKQFSLNVHSTFCSYLILMHAMYVLSIFVNIILVKCNTKVRLI